MSDNVIHLHEDEDIKLDDYMFVGITAEGKIACRLPENDEVTAILMHYATKALYESD